jgi:hypothetical protein
VSEWIHWLTIYAPVIFSAMMWFGPGWCCPPPCETKCEDICSDCDGDIKPCEVLVVIEGVVDDLCENCSDVDGSYLFSNTSGCLWENKTNPYAPDYWDGSACQSGPVVGYELQCRLRTTGSGSTYEVTAFWTTSPIISTSSMRWRQDGNTEKIDCFEDHVLPDYLRATGNGRVLACDGSLATCSVFPQTIPE